MTTKRGTGKTAVLCALACVLLTCESPASRVLRGGFGSANFSPRTDSKGFRWDPDQYGRINDGTSDCFDSAFYLTVNGNGFSASQRSGSADGSELMLTRMVGSNLEVTRRIKFHQKLACVRYVEVFRNNSGTDASVNAIVTSTLGGQGHSIVTDSGRPMGTALGKRDRALIVTRPPGDQRPAVVLHYGRIDKKHSPVFGFQNNRRTITATYNFLVPAGKTVSFSYGVAQRNARGAVSKSQARKLVSVFRSSKWLRDLPKEIAKTLLNKHRGGGTYSMQGLESLEEILGTARGGVDLLILGDETQIKGTASFKKMTVATSRGETDVAADRVVAVMGKASKGAKGRVLMRDGQILCGTVTVEGLRFTMNTGIAVELTIEELDRVIWHNEPGDGRPPGGTWLMVDTFGGNRLAVLRSTDQKLKVTTPWGQTTVSLEDIISMKANNSEPLGYRFETKNGSSFFGMLEASEVVLKTKYFGERRFGTATIRALFSAEKMKESDTEKEISEPHVVLLGENVLTGRIDTDFVKIVSLNKEIPIPVSQLRSMRNISDGDEVGRGKTVFAAETWAGDMITGHLAQGRLPIRIGSEICQVSCEDILEVTVPSPAVPPEMRAKITDLIRDLGDTRWERREAASRKLEGLGFMAKPQLKEVVKQTTDTEVRERAQALLDKLDT